MSLTPDAGLRYRPGMAWRALAWGTVLAIVAVLAYVWPFSVDDSYIVASYARRLATGLGYTFRAGPPTDGVTGPLWLVPLAAGARAGLDAALVSKVSGGLCALGTLVWLVRELHGRALGARAAAIAALFLATSVPFVTWAVAGLETAAAGLCTLALALGAGARPRVRPGLCAVASAALFWLRPELAPLALTLLAFAYVREPRAGLWAAALALASAAGVLAFRWLMFGHAWPMVSAAKPGVLAHGASYVFTAAIQLPALLLVGLLGWGIIRHGSSRERALCCALGVHALAVLLAGGDWMPGLRLFAPVAPLAALALGPVLARWSVRRAAQAAVVALLLFAVRLHETVAETREARAGGLALQRTATELARALGDVDGVLVALDVGALAYSLPNDVVDLGGLTEPHIAYAPGGHLDKRVDARWLESLRPARIILHSRERPRVDARGKVRWFAGYPVERRVLGMRWVLEHYRVERVIEHARDYFYVVLAPERSYVQGGVKQ